MKDFIAEKAVAWIYIMLLMSIAASTSVVASFGNSYYAPLIILTLVGAIISLIKPELLYYLAAISISIELLYLDIYVRSSMHDSIFFFHLLIFLALVAWMISMMAKTRAPYTAFGLEPIIFFFFLLSTISYFWSEDKVHGGVELFILYASLAGFILSTIYVKDKKSLNIILWIFICMGVLHAAISHVSLYTKYGGGTTVFFNYQKIRLLWEFNPLGMTFKGHGLLPPPATAFFLNLPILICVGMILAADNSKVRVILATCLLFMFSGYMTTLSKGSLLGFLGGAAFLILRVEAFKKRFITSVSCVIFLIIFSFLISHIPSLGKTLEFGVSRSVSTSEGDSAISKRIEFWTIGKDMVARSSGIGTGIGSYKQYNVRWPHAHSIYFSALFELGFLGLWAWLFILGGILHYMMLILKKCKDQYYRNLCLGYIAGYISILINGLFDFEYTYSIIWLYLGIGVGLAGIMKRHNSDNFMHKHQLNTSFR